MKHKQMLNDVIHAPENRPRFLALLDELAEQWYEMKWEDLPDDGPQMDHIYLAAEESLANELQEVAP